MSLTASDVLPLTSEEDILLVRRAVKEVMVQHQFSLIQQTKMVTAASELSRNNVIYGGGGVAIFELLQDSGNTGLRITFIDQGPGIADIDQALSDGFTTGKGLGLGLGGAKRLVQQFEIQSEPGGGARVSISMWK